MSKVFQADEAQPSIQEGIDLLYKTLDYEMQVRAVVSKMYFVYFWMYMK